MQSQFSPGLSGPTHVEPLDPANESLAEALRKSFWVLKLLMIVLVVLYFLSGWFSVKPNEVGFKLRNGRVVESRVDGESQPIVLSPGWHWSWPYPFERWQTVSSKERELPVEFMFPLSEAEKLSGKLEYKYDNRLTPGRDDYLITGDVNIIHATVTLKYQITDPVQYITHVHPAPNDRADERSPEYMRYPEYSLLTNITRNAVIETAAAQPALEIRGSRYNEFLRAAAASVNRRLDELANAGTPLGISVNPDGGIIAPKKALVEAIMPPRQVQEEFDRVIAVENGKARAIAQAQAEAEEKLTKAAGARYRDLAKAIDDEFSAILALSSATESSGSNGDDATSLESALKDKRAATEALLADATGEVQKIVKDAEIYADNVHNEALADYNRVKALLPEYRRDASILLARLRDETYARALENESVAKFYLPDSGRLRLNIQRSGLESPARKEQKPGVLDASSIGRNQASRIEALRSK
jgi:regulator of protease activity HflC (stomatin/prohibitin superfamily)